jgi:hypothetical protein
VLCDEQPTNVAMATQSKYFMAYSLNNADVNKSFFLLFCSNSGDCRENGFHTRKQQHGAEQGFPLEKPWSVPNSSNASLDPVAVDPQK